ncbi:zinc finger A20 and AN1 domain-containing stress-associated protein 5-like [Cicer arietinum]|uniref:Zinc finger A20 and AN1 domain-containing stress-associated protein 5-like n=1 Tax=Cicer arietinum TaxID=3827 RepID=A0A1S2Y5X9_CICAR|nr:zinc finger A20 and AN1 domain-containing stress-associated protein 5-like [Cicer arietinum]
MAQRTENEETEFKVPETITVCINNCGVTVTGNAATNNMCQNCFTASTATTSSTVGISSQSSRSGVISVNSVRSPKRSLPEESSEITDRNSSDQTTISEAKRVVSRCSGCRRKVGLTGFRCRCGDLFCSEHRYSDRHDCSFDYKAAGREAIARENPVIRAAKIVKV